jgi:nitrogen fixation/metabolism regulation signal transduction histidine kinase
LKKKLLPLVGIGIILLGIIALVVFQLRSQLPHRILPTAGMLFLFYTISFISICLFISVIINLIKLISERKRAVIGSAFKTRLTLALSLVPLFSVLLLLLLSLFGLSESFKLLNTLPLTKIIQDILVLVEEISESETSSEKLSFTAERLQETFREFRKIELATQPMKVILSLTFILTSLLILNSALWFGFRLAESIARPMEKLLRGLEKVFEGNLNYRINFPTKTEFSHLITAFNQMTARLQQSRQELARAQKIAAWREVAQRVAHEIKNTLTPLKLSAEHLLRKLGGTPSYPYIQNIINQIKGLENLLSGFSQFAQMPKLNCRKCSLNQILKEIKTVYSSADKNIEINLDLDPALPPCSVDPILIRQAFTNLINNSLTALEGSPEGRILLKTSFDSQHLKVEILDNGRGIAPEIKDKLFTPYFSTTKKGLGLGLAITNQIITAHGGKLELFSKINQGTKVVLTFPKMKDER